MSKSSVRLTEGAIHTVLVRMTVPVAFSLFAHFLFNIVDTIWLGRLGTVALAAAGSAGFVVWMILSFARIMPTGVMAMVAQAIGAGQPGRARLATTRALLLSQWVALGTGGLVVWLLPRIFVWMGTAPDVAEAGRAYLGVTVAGLPLMFLGMAIEGVFRAHGDTHTPMWILLATLAGNAVLDPFFIFGWGPFPAWGVAGAALATVLCRGVGALVLTVMLVRRRWGVSVGRWLRRRKAYSGDSWVMLRVGMPGSISDVFFSLVYMVLVRIATPYGTAPVAALTVGHRVESLSYLLCVAFGTSVGAMVGQNLGAREVQRARHAIWMAVLICWIWMVPAVALFLFRPEWITRLFSSDPVLLVYAGGYLRWVAPSQFFMALEVILGAAFAGAGRTWLPALVVIPTTMLRIPMAAWLSGMLGANGVWAAISLCTIITGLGLVAVYRWSGWERGLLA
ncbi:MAG: MATE family efflux transporter [Verrucomicrobiota bacterium]|jgi:putative MATE family efflux protein